MFPNSSFDKTRVEMSENCLPQRGNNSRRFPVGISSASAGDDNQNMRIQLAVHKYNNSTNGFVNKRRTLNSTVKHSFFKNSYKSKGYEVDSDSASKSEKKCEMQYEGVGNFPTVHLKKSAVLYRPIRKFNESKYLHPELPVNRFLNQLPELCSDLKSRTRSVLDVLQDISTKKIQSKDDNDCITCTPKGLGGDLPDEEKLLSRPLFVQKPKESIVSMKDNATQTLTPQNSKVSNVTPNNSITKVDSFGPRAELRKKLAKQINEISASLSSSISSTMSLKRKLADKISGTKDDRNKSDASVVKKPKILDNHIPSNKGNVLAVNGKSNLNEFSSQTSKLYKLTDENATSPNKDRLMRIFLDIDNFNSKNQIFQNSAKSSESNSYSAKDNSSIESNAFINGNGSTVNNDSVESRNAFSSSKNSNLSKTNSFSLSESLGKGSNCGTSNLVHETVSSNSVNNHLISNETSPSSTSSFKFDSSNKLNFTSNESETKSTSTDKNAVTTASSTTSSTMVFPISGTDDNVTSKNTVPETFTATCNNSSKENQDKNKESNNFVFGNYGNLSSNGNVFQAGGETKKTDSSGNGLSTAATTNSSSGSQFSFGLNGGFATSNSSALLQPNNNISVPTTVASASVTNFAAKPSFTLEQTCATRQENAASIPNKPEEKTETLKNGFSFKMHSNQESSAPSGASSVNFDSGKSSAATSSFGQNSPPSIFSFGQKSSGTVETSKSNEKTVGESGANAAQQSLTPFGTTTPSESGNSSTAVISQSSSFGFNPTGNTTDVKSSSLFSGTANVTGTLEQKNSPVPVNFSSGNTSTQSKSQSGFNFIFGQKSCDQNSSTNAVTSKDNSSEQNGQVKAFSFGQSSPAQNQSSSNTQATEFGQNNLQSSTVSQSNQVPTLGSNQNVATMPSMNFGANAGAGNLGSFSATPIFGNSTFSAKENSFSTSLNKFGAASGKSDGKFGDSAFQTTAKFGFSAAAESTSTFGQPQTTQTNVSFGTASGFPTTTTVMATPKFGDSTATQRPLFGSPMSTPAFAENNKPTSHEGLTSGNIFGQSNNPPISTPSATGINSAMTASFNAPAVQNVFGLSTNQDSIFGKSTKIQTGAFGNGSSPAQSLATPNNFVFGSSTANSASLTQSLAKTTASTGFALNPAVQSSGSASTFGGSTAPTGFTLNPSAPSSGSPSTFGSSTASTGFNSSPATPFAFNSQPNNNNSFVFKPSAEGSGFINSNPSAVNFGGQMNNNNNGGNNLETKPASAVFNFGSSQLTAGSTFNFGSTPSPSVFSFGGSGSGTNSSSTFSFGTPQPGGQGTPSSTMSTPGFFNIGSGSTQSRPRASNRLRRRPCF